MNNLEDPIIDINKELEALNWVRQYEYINPKLKERLDIIETALKEYQVHEEILNDYGLILANFREACLLLAMLKGEGRNIHNIDKQLKALEIIKEKIDWVATLKSLKHFTKEECELLKEVLL